MGEIPAHTYLLLSPRLTHTAYHCLLVERGAHKPSLGESLAPFHPDPSQRIFVLCLSPFSPCLVLRVEALFQFLGGDVGSEIAWDVWMSHVVVASIDLDLRGVRVCVSGCRLFSLPPTDPRFGVQIEVHDFSAQACAEHSSKIVNGGPTEPWVLVPPRVRKQVQLGYTLEVHSSHDSIAFFEVSFPVRL